MGNSTSYKFYHTEADAKKAKYEKELKERIKLGIVYYDESRYFAHHHFTDLRTAQIANYNDDHESTSSSSGSDEVYDYSKQHNNTYNNDDDETTTYHNNETNTYNNNVDKPQTETEGKCEHYYQEPLVNPTHTTTTTTSFDEPKIHHFSATITSHFEAPITITSYSSDPPTTSYSSDPVPSYSSDPPA